MEYRVEIRQGNDQRFAEDRRGEIDCAGRHPRLCGQRQTGNERRNHRLANYFVKDIGIAKIKMEVFGMPLVIELEKFEPAK